MPLRRTLPIFALTIFILSGCAKAVREFNPGMGLGPNTKSTTQTKPQPSHATSSLRGSSSSSLPAARIIDMVSLSQQEFPVKKDGYEESAIFASKDGDAQFLKVTKMLKLHRHAGLSHVVYVLGGQGKLTLNDAQSDLHVGQAIIIPPGTKHKFEKIGEQPLYLLHITLPQSKASDVQWLE